MTLPAMNRERLESLMAGFARSRIAVVGDFFLDKYLDVEPAWEEISLETGKPAHQVAGIRTFPGAAGTVVSNLRALGANELFAVGFTGDDGEGFELRRCLEQLGCSTRYLTTCPERHTPTYLKPRDRTRAGLEGEHSRYDTKNHEPTPPSIEQNVIDSLNKLIDRVDAVVVMDQVEEENCGVLTKTVREAACETAKQNPRVMFWADSRRNIQAFRDVIVKPNQFEAAGILNPKDGEEIPLDQLTEAAFSIKQKTNRPVFVTCGKAGLLVVNEESTEIPAVKIEGPIDPTGAGDSTTAGAVLALCSGAGSIEAGIIGNLVASLTIQQLATTGTARADELPAQLERWLNQIGDGDLA